VSPKRGDRVAPPPGEGEWDVIYGTKESDTGWHDLCQQVPGPTRDAWEKMRSDPAPRVPTHRQHRLKGTFATGGFQGRTHDQWQIEVTGGGRVWYLVDPDRRRVIVKFAGTGHPKATE
jgi:CubicO group peptidase (beta-lactamase class C family)